MRWKCPACGTPIRHNEFDPAPQANTLYRCHICRLELVVDEKIDKLIVAPIASPPTPPPHRPKPK
jgi:hypothetical protein